MKRCLFITTQFPYPLDNGGKIGAFNGLCVVSEYYKVTVLSFTEEINYHKEGIGYFNTKLPNVHFEIPIEHDIHIRKKPTKLIKTLAKDYLLSKPYVTLKFLNPKMFKLIDDLFDENGYFDLVFIDYLNMGVYQEYIQDRYINNYGMIILKDHNIEYEIVKQEAEKSVGIKKIILDREWKITKAYEEMLIQAADKVFSVCRENTLFLKYNNSLSYTMLPTFEMLPTRVQPTGHRILFMGNLSWGANLEGLKWFVDVVMPIVLKEIPDALITIVGSGPNKEAFSNCKYVDYRGYVKDISNIYDTHSLFVVPLFEGSGIRIKILEAFNNEIPVVSTSLGCETIGASHNKEIMVADDGDSFANCVVELLKNKDKREQMAFRAKKFLEKNFSLRSRQLEFWEIVNGKEKDSIPR